MANNVLKSFIAQYFPKDSIDSIIAELDQTGTISEDSFRKAGIKKNSTLDFIKGQIKELAPQTDFKNLSKGQLKNYLGLGGQDGAVVDESTLTDEALKQREDVFKQLSDSKGEVDQGGLQRDINQQLEDYGITGASRELKDALGHFVNSAQRLPDPIELRDYLQEQGQGGVVDSSYPPLVNFLNDQNAKTHFSSLVSDQLKAPNTYDDVTRIEDLLSSRGEAAKQDEQITTDLQGIQDSLSGNRDAYIQSLQNANDSNLQDTAQYALNQENAAGRLNSGSTGDVLSSIYGGNQGDIENIQAQLSAQDNQFYFNAAYQNQLRKMLEGNADYANALASEKGRVLGEQQNRFNTTQTTLQNNQSNNLLMQQYNSALKNAQLQAQRQADYNKNQKTAGIYSGIGSTVGGIAGAAIGGPTGAIIGAGIGGGGGASFQNQ